MYSQIKTTKVMRTIEISIYKFSELSDESKRKALDKFEPFVGFIYDDAHETVKAFCEVFGVKEGRHNWLDFNTDYIDDNILELTGQRLRTYLINNFYSEIYKPKTYYKGVNKKRKSKIFVNNDCVLTGVCYDHDMLEGIYNFIQKPCEHTDFKDLIGNAFHDLRKSVEDEASYRYSDEAKIEDIEANDYEFYEDGNIA